MEMNLYAISIPSRLSLLKLIHNYALENVSTTYQTRQNIRMFMAHTF